MKIVSKEPGEHTEDVLVVEPGDAVLVLRTNGTYEVMAPHMADNTELMIGDPLMELTLYAVLQEEDDLKQALLERTIAKIKLNQLPHLEHSPGSDGSALS